MSHHLRKKYCFLIWTLCVGISLFCYGSEPMTISLQEMSSIGSPDDDLLFQWAGITVDKEGDIYLTDALEYTVKKINRKGDLICKTGRKGRGPGEFLAPRFIDCTDEWIYVTDQEKWGIQVFSKDLVFERHIPLAFPVSEMKVINDETIVLGTVSYRDSGKFFVIDGRGNTTRVISYLEEKSPFMMDMIDLIPNPDGGYYIAYSFQDKVEKLDSHGNKLWSLHLLNKRIVSKKKFNSLILPTEVVFKDVALDPMGNVYVLGGHHSENRSRDVYVLDKNGKFISRLVLLEASHCLHIDDRGYLYSRANEGVTLKIYKLIFQDRPALLN